MAETYGWRVIRHDPHDEVHSVVAAESISEVAALMEEYHPRARVVKIARLDPAPPYSERYVGPGGWECRVGPRVWEAVAEADVVASASSVSSFTVGAARVPVPQPPAGGWWSARHLRRLSRRFGGLDIEGLTYRYRSEDRDPYADMPTYAEINPDVEDEDE